MLIICYDLRFPVWARNRKNNYDLLICPANWPQVRSKVWQVLLPARALENACYVCGVNRIGDDGSGIHHKGDSLLFDFKGEEIIRCVENREDIQTGIIDKEALDKFRKKFPVWKDADNFQLINSI